MLVRRSNVNSPFARFVDQMLENASREYAPFAEMQSDFALALDIADSDANYVVTASLPGVKSENIDINLHDNVLTISAEVKDEHNDEKGTRIMQERHYGKFTRSVRFAAPVNAENIEASYSDGVLTLNVPKLQNGGAKRIAVKNGSGNKSNN